MSGERDDPDARWLRAVMHTAFLLLLVASLARFLLHHRTEPRAPWIVALGVVLAVLYALGSMGRAGRPARRVWLGGAVAAWVVLVLLAPSFALVAVPLFFIALRTVRTRTAVLLVPVLTVLVVAAQLRLAHGFDPNLVLAPPAIAALCTAVFVYLQRQTDRQRALIGDLVATRRELAETERREGMLAERGRLSAEIHDTLAQGLSSQQMLLQAAERTWDADPGTARGHLRTASEITERNLAEARRFVHGLAPVDLATGGGLVAALRAVAEREREQTGIDVQVHVDEEPGRLPGQVESALLRIAQGALVNACAHGHPTRVAITVSDLGDRVVLDVADDGTGFDPAAVPAPGPDHGHGIAAMHARVRQLGGTLIVESAPGEGTVVSVEVPLDDGHDGLEGDDDRG